MTIEQINTLFLFILMGIVIGILFDMFRILRKSFRTPDILTYIQDFTFWILSGLILLYSIFKFNNGELRAYVFFGIILGVFIYMLLLSKHIINFFVKLISIIKSVVSYPIRILYNFFQKYIFIRFCKVKKKFSNFISKKYNKCKKNDKFINNIHE